MTQLPILLKKDGRFVCSGKEKIELAELFQLTGTEIIYLFFCSFNFSIILLLGDISQFLVAWWMKMDFVSVLYLTPELLAVFEIKVKS